MTGLSIMQIGACLAHAVDLKKKPLCAYGSEQIPQNGVRSALISNCLAHSMYKIATGMVNDPVYIGDETGQIFCRCIGGPAWFGYGTFDPRLAGLMAAGSKDMPNGDPKYLKQNEGVAFETYKSLGRIEPLGKYAVIRRCEDMHEDPGVKCFICFATGEQMRDLCGLAHFRSRDVFDLVSVPWGPACATLVTYPAGMAEKALSDRIYVGPTDPSAREWMPENYMAMGIPAEVARTMAEDIESSFLGKRGNLK